MSKRHSEKISLGWKIYFWLILPLIGLSYINGPIHFWLAVDFIISTPAVVGLFLWAYHKNWLSQRFWVVYFWIFLVWELIYKIVIEPKVSGEPFQALALLAPVLLIPLYVALYRYAHVLNA